MIKGIYECPTHKEQSEFKTCSNVDLYTMEAKLKYTESDKDYNKLFPLENYVKFNCGCFFKFKQIDLSEDGKVTNIIFK